MSMSWPNCEQDWAAVASASAITLGVYECPGTLNRSQMPPLDSIVMMLWAMVSIIMLAS